MDIPVGNSKERRLEQFCCNVGTLNPLILLMVQKSEEHQLWRISIFVEEGFVCRTGGDHRVWLYVWVVITRWANSTIMLFLQLHCDHGIRHVFLPWKRLPPLPTRFINPKNAGGEDSMSTGVWWESITADPPSIPALPPSTFTGEGARMWLHKIAGIVPGSDVDKLLYVDRLVKEALNEINTLVISCIHPRNLTWNLKIMVSKRTFLFHGLIFRFHVKFRGCMWDCTAETNSSHLKIGFPKSKDGFLTMFFSGAMLVLGRVVQTWLKGTSFSKGIPMNQIGIISEVLKVAHMNWHEILWWLLLLLRSQLCKSQHFGNILV